MLPQTLFISGRWLNIQSFSPLGFAATQKPAESLNADTLATRQF